ncbi:MAG: cadmium-translocating P-type ATPase [Pseudonocardia sp.]|uniref:heavy metal translocating P-type ATPase n=1 Tax=Pseudonocardia sp. TaxID=60912 RepID=UPI000869D76E|nr:heavy metal translocating P-type ATPase [Pseudonocardia sp.]MBN9113252.1 cadmium-translocating P-type ATPase [Pseudonocardia sp.]ODU26243.1 MAG: cadmium-translocating P-type ATPase [Pseudonocardia sp. SCN 72-51]
MLPEVRYALLALAAFAVAVPAQLLDAPVALTATAWVVCYVAGGWEPAWSGLRSLRHGSLDVDLLMIVAALAAAAIGQPLDGGLLVVIFATSGALEAVMTARTRRGIEALLDLAPETAVRLENGSESQVPARDLRTGDVVLVRPGDRIPADGEVVDGASEVDTASLTGEPLPRPAGIGTAVHAGTVNGTGVLRVRVDRDPGDWVVAGIRERVERATESSSERQLLIERIEQPYSVGVVVVTLALLGIPMLVGAEFEPTLLRAMTFMIVASPCAVVLATMPPLLAAIAVASRRGALLRDATVVEALAAVDTVALDKTGTLTSGTPRVVEVRATDPDALVALAAAAEAGSEHALGRAIREEADRRRLVVPAATGFTAEPGIGVRATVRGQVVTVGRPAPGSPETAVDGATAVVVRVDGEVAGVLALADDLRPGAADAVASLTALTGRTPALLTGDADRPAAAVAGRLGISEVHAGLLPDGKADVVDGWRRDGRTVLAAGDGVNDAPLLAVADVGLAVGHGASALSVQAGDGVLLRDPMGGLPALVTLSRRATRVAKANLVFAGAVIAGLVAWDLIGTLPLVLGVAGHELSTVVVCLNGLRLLAGRSASRTPEVADRRATRGEVAVG